MKRMVVTGMLLFASWVSAGAQEKTTLTIATGSDPSLAQFYVAKEAGIFAKHGLDVQLNTGATASGMVPFLIKNQVQAVISGEQAGLSNFNLDKDVVVAAEGNQMPQFYGIVGRNIENIDGLKGKKIGVPVGTGGEIFWRAFLDVLKLDPKNYTVVAVEPPEMIAALERGNIDAFAAWEPWVTRSLTAVPGTKVVRDNDGIVVGRNFIWINRSWAEANPKAAASFMHAIGEATDMIRTKPDDAAKLVSALIKLDPKLTRTLLDKVKFDLRLDQGSIDHLKMIEGQLASAGKLTKPIEWDKFVYPTLIKQVKPEAANYKLP